MARFAAPNCDSRAFNVKRMGHYLKIIMAAHDWAEEKRTALDAWSAHLLAVAEGRLPAGKVLPFGRAGSGEM
jgi:hypothetical protein